RAFLLVADLAEADSLDGDRAADGGIRGQVYHSHGAAAQLPHDLVPSDAVHQNYSVRCKRVPSACSLRSRRRRAMQVFRQNQPGSIPNPFQAGSSRQVVLEDWKYTLDEC